MVDIEREHARAWKLLVYLYIVVGLFQGIAAVKYPSLYIESRIGKVVAMFAIWFAYIAMRSLYLSLREGRTRNYSSRA